MAGATLRWNPFSDTDVDLYRVYRAITGLVIPYPSGLQDGDVLKFAATSSTVQSLIFESTLFQDIIDTINEQAKGLHASAATVGPAAIIVRCTAKQDPKLKIFPCSAGVSLGLSATVPTLLGPRMDFVEIGTVPFVSVDQAYEFEDPDGDATDWYHICSEKDLVLSVPSQNIQPLVVPPDVCVIEGRVTDLMNNPIIGALVSAQIQVPDVEVGNSGITITPIEVRTDELGRWSIPLIQCQLVLFQIPSISYNQVVYIPEASGALFQDLKPVNDHFYEPSGEPVTG